MRQFAAIQKTNEAETFVFLSLAETAGILSEDEKADLARLRKELEHVRKAKAEFVCSICVGVDGKLTAPETVMSLLIQTKQSKFITSRKKRRVKEPARIDWPICLVKTAYLCILNAAYTFIHNSTLPVCRRQECPTESMVSARELAQELREC